MMVKSERKQDRIYRDEVPNKVKGYTMLDRILSEEIIKSQMFL
jgi:hypothetical protein